MRLKNYFILFGLLWPCLRLPAQNMVPDPGFEQYSRLPADEGDAHLLRHWHNPAGPGRLQYPKATPDYFHRRGKDGACLPEVYYGYAQPFEGDAVAGLYQAQQFREYLSTALTQKLTKGRRYEVTLRLTCGQPPLYADSLAWPGVLFSHDMPRQAVHEPLEHRPQIRWSLPSVAGHWQELQGIFEADSAYSWLTLGDFGARADTAAVYYFVDAVSVRPLPLTLEGREVRVQQQEKIRSRQLTLQIFDAKRVDGDTISVYYNGQWLIRHHAVTKKPIRFTVELLPDQPNYLILFAHNLGRYPPNTAVVRWTANGRPGQLELSSALDYCGAVELICDP